MGIRVDPVDGGIVGKIARRESGVESWDFGADVCDVVEECTGIASQLLYA